MYYQQPPYVNFQSNPGYYPNQYPSYQYQNYPNYPFFQGPTSGGPYPQDESSYIENILRLNLGKIASVYMNFENSQWGSKIFKGRIEAAGKDHIILSDPSSNVRYILLTIYLDYITFDEEINYFYNYGATNFQNKPE